MGVPDGIQYTQTRFYCELFLAFEVNPGTPQDRIQDRDSPVNLSVLVEITVVDRIRRV